MQETTTAPPTQIFTRTFPALPAQVSEARVFLRAALGDCPAADDLTLCMSEMAANSVLHSASRMPGGTFTVHAEIHEGSYLWIEVTDKGGHWNRRRHRDGRGHGLDIIRALASECGIDGDNRTRVTWARFDWAAPGDQPRPAQP
jgi:anti-sigma regulatory factor (Ser/Thr protein kinase)